MTTKPTGFKVLTATLAGWADCWTDDDAPVRYSTIAEAEAEIAQHIADATQAVEDGDMSDVPSREDYLIVPEDQKEAPYRIGDYAVLRLRRFG